MNVSSRNYRRKRTLTLLALLIRQLVYTQDADKDGTVSQKEYGTQSSYLFTKLDTNQDGSIETVELKRLPERLIGH